ncbi:MAG: zinc-dependent peptidase [Rhodoferax sp.]
MWAPALAVLGLGLLALGWLLAPPLWRRWRRQRLGRQAFPALWRIVLRKRVPLTRQLPADLRRRLQRRIQIFLAEVPIIGCQGLEVDDEIRVTIAAHACLITLNRPEPHYPNLRQVLVYPDSFVVPRDAPDAAGVVHAHHEVLAGESWSEGQVILSWADVLAGAAQARDGRNVAIHEFAHQLDQAHGAATGAPELDDAAQAQRWAEVWSAAFREHRSRLAWGKPTLFDRYAAKNPAEFFAVVSEVFFERCPALAQQHPELHQALVSYYRLDPCQWR